MRKEISIYIGEKGVNNFIFTDLDLVEDSKQAFRNCQLKRPFYFETANGYCCGFFITQEGNYTLRRYGKRTAGYWVIKVSKPERKLMLIDYYSQLGFVQNTLFFSFAIVKSF